VKSSGRLLVATWNIANLGVQERRDKDYQLIAEMVCWFDLVAVQEVSDSLAGLRGILSLLPASWLACSPTRQGRTGLRSLRRDQGQLVGEGGGGGAAAPLEVRDPNAGVEAKFEGFDHNPYLAASSATCCSRPVWPRF
jgi:hypothetical protein